MTLFSLLYMAQDHPFLTPGRLRLNTVWDIELYRSLLTHSTAIAHDNVHIEAQDLAE
jgi:hypothetical protein